MSVLGCTMMTLKNGVQRFVYLTTVRTASQGLDASRSRTELVSIDPVTNESTTKPFTFSPERNWRLGPATGGFSAISVSGGTATRDAVYDIAFFDADTLSVTAQNHGDGYHPIDLVAYNYDGYALKPGAQSGADGPVHVYRGSDGKEIGSVNGATGDAVSFDHGFLLRTKGTSRNDVSASYFDTSTGSTTATIAPDIGGGGQAPSTVTIGSNILIADGVFRNFLVVFNTTTRKTVLSLDAARLSGLNIKSAQIAGDYLYLANDSDNPVIDVRTSQRVSQGWTVFPVARLADGWTYVHGGMTGSDCFGVGTGFGTSCTVNTSADRIVRSASGDYQGPWY